MNVRIVNFPETKIAVLEHHGSPALEYQSIQKLIEWRMQNKFSPEKHLSYGIHYNDPRKIKSEEYHVDLCVSIDNDIYPNSQGIINKVIPSSGETLRDFPLFFHYVNVGAHIRASEMITDVYLPVI